MNDTPLLTMKGIVKRFPGVNALKNVSLEIARGEVHALLGENGAGKSTLMKCLLGIYQPDGGEIIFDGEHLEHTTTANALKKGISMIHQELSPVLHRPIMENIWLGREPVNRFGLVDHAKMAEMSREVLNRIDFDIDPAIHMSELTVAKMQMVEIAKAISYDAKLIIMDEPSSALTEHEQKQLFKIINRVRAEGTSIIYISHRLNEIMEIADRATVLRDGEYIGTRRIEDLTMDDMITMMIGRELSDLYPKVENEIGEPVLEVRGLSHEKYFKDVSFTLHSGEILGIAGLVGAGRTEVVETIFGIRPKIAGEIRIHGEKVEIHQPTDAIHHRMAFLTEDRRQNGIYGPLPIHVNVAISSYDEFLNRLGLIDQKEVDRGCDDFVGKMQIKTPSLNTKIENLSGGNQQKVLLARWLMTQPEILFLDEPTRGIDIGAKAEIYKLMTLLAKEGKSILMVSSEMPEVLGMSDRILVMHEGKVTGILDNTPDLTQDTILRYATGTVTQPGV